MSAMTPMLEIVLGPTAVVSIVGALTLRSLTHSSSATADKQNKLYQDKDGQATMESQQNAEIIFHRRAAYAAAGIVASVIPVLRNASDTSSSSVDAVLWLLLTTQVTSIARKSCPFQTYGGVKNALASSVCIFVYATHKLLCHPAERVNFIRMVPVSFVAIMLLSLPRRPIVYVKGQEVLDRNGASLLSNVFFSYNFLSRKTASSLSAKLALEDVPLPDYTLRSGPLQEQFVKFSGAGRLWLQLLWSLLAPLSKQWLFVIIKAASELSSRHALFQLLRGLEFSGASVESQWGPLTWAICMGLALLSTAVADGWLYWVTTGELLTSATSILQTAIYDKVTVRKNVHGGPRDEKKLAAAAHQDVGDKLFSDTNVITKAVTDNYYLPLALFKILLDIFYIVNLLGVKSIIVGAAFPVITILLSKRLASHHQVLRKAQMKSRSRLTGVVTEALQNLRHIRLASLEGMWSKRLCSAYADEEDKRWQANVELQKLNLVAGLGPVLLASAAISVSALEAGHLNPSVAFTALNLFGTLYEVFTQLPAKLASLHTSFISCQRLEKYLKQPNQVKSSVASDSILLQQACLAWPASVECHDEAAFQLSDVTLDFPRNKLSLVTGAVGSGKSLLLTALLDEATIMSGRFEKPEIQVSQEQEPNLVVGSTAFVSQPPWIDSGSVRDNITFGYPFKKERYEKVVTACALCEDLESLRDGDSTAAGENGASLSGGQKWRIALARALYSPAEILVLEDVLSAVDVHVASWICDHALTGELATGRTIILATHRPEFCTSLASYVVQIDAGVVKASSKLAEAAKKQASDGEESPCSIHVPRTVKPAPATETPPVNPAKPVVRATKGFLSTFSSYILSSGISLYLFGALITVCYQGVNASHTLWLARWTSAKQDGVDERKAAAVGVFVYLMLSISGTVALAVQSLVFVNIGMAAARSAFTVGVDSMLAATLAWMDTTPFGGLFQSLDNDMHILDNLLGPSLNGIFGTVLHLLVIIITSSYSNTYTAFISIAVLIAYAYIAPEIVKPGQKLRPLLVPSMHPMTNHANATVLGLTTIRAFGQTERYRERMLTLVDKSATVGLHVQLGGCWGKTRLDLLSCVFVTGTAAAMAYRHVDAATTGLTITLALQLRAAMASLLGQVSMTSMGLAAAERVFALREIPKEVGQETPLSKGERPTKGSLEVNSLEVRYMADLEPVLKGVFFSIQAGQRLGIVGRTGAGKTTLTNALLRFVEASKGSISIGGVDISQLSLRDLRSAVGIIPQDPFLFSGTLRENLDPSGSKSDKALIAALQRMRLIKDDDLAGAFSDLGMLIHVGGANLSHGQRQLICLARAMVKEHSVLILDEATSSVDNATDELVQEIIKAEFGAKTVVVVAHKLMTAACMDKVLILSHGEAVELGSPRELLEKKGVFWDMVDQSGQKMEIESAVISSVDPNI